MCFYCFKMYSKFSSNIDGGESYDTFETMKRHFIFSELETIFYPKERGKEHKFMFPSHLSGDSILVS